MLTEISKLNIQNLPNILLIFGEEEFLIEESLDFVRNNIVPKISDPYDIDVFNGNEVDIKKVVDIARSFPFMSEKRSLIVKNIDLLFNLRSKKSEANSLFIKYLEETSNSTFLILTSTLNNLNGLSKKYSTLIKSIKSPFKELIEKHEWIEHPKVWENQLYIWLKNRFKVMNIQISDSAIQLILSNTNPNLRDISNEIEKLLIFNKKNNIIEDDDVIASIGISRQYNVYELQKSIGNCNLKKSLEIAEYLVLYDKAEMLILSILYRFFSALFKLYDLSKSNHNKYDLASKLGVNPYFLDDYQVALKNIGIKRIENAFKYMVQTDTQLKSTSIDSLYLIQNMIINILT